MLKLTITTYDAGVTVQDPKPVTATGDDQAVISVGPNDTHEMLMQWGQLERLQGQLTDLANQGFLTFVIEPADVAEFAEQYQNLDAPSIDGVDNGGAAITAAGDTFDIIGNELLAGQVRASASVLGDTVAGSVLLEDLNPSYAGNLYDVEVVAVGSGAATCAHAVVDGRTVITVNLKDTTTETCTTIAALIAADMAGLVQATVVGVGATVISTVQAVTPFTGGIGLGLNVLFGGLACTVDAIDASGAPIYVLTVTSPSVAAFLAAGDTAVLKVRSNDKVTTANLTLV